MIVFICILPYLYISPFSSAVFKEFSAKEVLILD